jgi:hypothetical protein
LATIYGLLPIVAFGWNFDEADRTIIDAALRPYMFPGADMTQFFGAMTLGAIGAEALAAYAWWKSCLKD